jgi:hypothetical protein
LKRISIKLQEYAVEPEPQYHKNKISFDIQTRTHYSSTPTPCHTQKTKARVGHCWIKAEEIHFSLKALLQQNHDSFGLKVNALNQTQQESKKLTQGLN